MGSFGREIKDFIGAFQAGNKIFGSQDDRAYKKLRNQILTQKAADAADPELRDLAKNKLKAQINRLNRGPKAMDPLDRAIKEQRLKYYRSLDPENQPKEPGPSNSAAPMVGPQGALNVDPSYDTADLSDTGDAGYEPASYDTADTGYDTGDTEDTQFGAVGGMITRRGNKKKVKGYADGGLVDDSEYSSGDDDTADEADYMDAQDSADEPETSDNSDEEATESAVPASGATKTASKGETPKFSYQAAHDAALAGVKYSRAHHEEAAGVNDAPQGAVATEELSAAPRRSAAAIAHAKGEGAVSQDEMQKTLDAVDPDHKLPESQRRMAALAHVYEWTIVNKGPEAADRAAASLTQYMRMESDRHKALAQVAATHGDIDGTIKNILRAEANVPDGRDLKITQNGDKLVATFTDEQTGKTVEKHILSPDQLLQWATKGGIQDFDSLLARSAGGRAELKDREARGDKQDAKAEKQADKEDKAAQQSAVNAINTRNVEAKERANDLKAAAAKTIKPSDEKTLLEQNEEQTAALPETEKPQAKDINAIALQIRANNGSKGYSDAFQAARRITQVQDPSNPMAASFSYTQDPKSGNVTFKTDVGDFVAPPDLARRMSAMWKANADKAQAVLNTKKAAADRAAQNGNAAMGVVRSMGGNPAPMRGVPVLGPNGFTPSVPLDEAPPGSVPYRGLGER